MRLKQLSACLPTAPRLHSPWAPALIHLPPHHPVPGLPIAVTLGQVTAGPSNATIRFTHKPWYSQGLQARVRVWNPIGTDGKQLAAGKEVEETLPAPNNATAGIIPVGAGNLARVVSACGLNTRFPTVAAALCTVHWRVYWTAWEPAVLHVFSA